MFAQTCRPSINHKNLPNSSPRYMRNGDVISEATSILVLEVEGDPTEKRMYPWKIQGFLPEKKNGVKQKTTKIEQKTLGKYMLIFMMIAFGLVKLFLIFFGPNIWICLPTWSLSRSCHSSNKEETLHLQVDVGLFLLMTISRNTPNNQKLETTTSKINKLKDFDHCFRVKTPSPSRCILAYPR